MSDELKCNECGRPIPVDAEGAFCRHCLLAMALSDGTEGSDYGTTGLRDDRTEAEDRGRKTEDKGKDDQTTGLQDHGTKSEVGGRRSEHKGRDYQTTGLQDDGAAAPPTPIAEKPGDRIGRYKLLQHLGEGGMGSVWLAEQMEPVRRMVALKVIKPGMDSAQVLARFEAERQALALMDHPNIAKVLDAGATPSGRPYFVMDLVKGLPLIKFCDEQCLSVRERLELFMQVCQGVQHAHQKGIIHRDLKPSNVMVALYDGRPVPKVIDFGVAKATGQRLTERTVFTQLGAVVGTLEYMSPEQAELNQLDIDTRSDIYSLGVLLYELLTGTTPLMRDKLRHAAFDAILKRIREEEPPKPSARLSTSGDLLPTVSAQRKLEPGKLAKVMQGELDWIVMKALEKDRNRRYETANGLALDIQRHLHGEPVAAGPPTARYRMVKLARKHRKLVAAAAAFVALLAVASVVSTGLALWANRERKEKEAQHQRAETIAVAETKAKNDANQQRRHAEEALSQIQIHKAAELFAANNASEALAYLAQVLRQDPSNSVATQRILGALSQRRFAFPTMAISGKGGEVSSSRRDSVTFSGDGHYLRWVSPYYHRCILRDLRTGVNLPGMYRCGDADFSPDGERIVTAD